MNASARVCAVIVRFAADSLLADCLDSLKASTIIPKEICVIDNRPSDGFVDAIPDKPEGVRVLAQERNIGFAAGCNMGIRATAADLVLILNDDTKLHPDCIEALVDAFDRCPRLAACQPKILSASKPTYFEYAGASGGFLDMFGVPFMRGRIMETVEEDTGQYDEERDVFWASGAAMMVRRSSLEVVGLFDEEFFAHMEEIDLCWRLHMMGCSVKAIPKAIAYHVGGGTLPYNTPLKTFYNYRNNWRMLLKNFSLWPLVVVVPARLTLDLGTILYFLAKGKPRFGLALANALLSAAISLHSTLKARAEVIPFRRVSESGLHHLIYRRPLLIDYFFWRRREFSRLAFPGSRLLLRHTGRQPSAADKNSSS